MTETKRNVRLHTVRTEDGGEYQVTSGCLRKQFTYKGKEAIRVRENLFSIPDTLEYVDFDDIAVIYEALIDETWVPVDYTPDKSYAPGTTKPARAIVSRAVRVHRAQRRAERERCTLKEAFNLITPVNMDSVNSPKDHEVEDWRIARRIIARLISEEVMGAPDCQTPGRRSAKRLLRVLDEGMAAYKARVNADATWEDVYTMRNPKTKKLEFRDVRKFRVE